MTVAPPQLVLGDNNVWPLHLDASEGGGWLLIDAGFDAAAGEVLYLPSAARLRKMAANTKRVRLVAVDEAGERTLGEYTFAHTPG